MHPIEAAWSEGRANGEFDARHGEGAPTFWEDSEAAAFLAASDWRERLPTEEEWIAGYVNGRGMWLVQVQDMDTGDWGALRLEGRAYEMGTMGWRVRSRPVTRDGERAVWPEVG